MEYKSYIKTIDAIVKEYEQYNQQREVAYKEFENVVEQITSFEPPVVTLTNEEYAKLSKPFVESELYAKVQELTENVRKGHVSCVADHKKVSEVFTRITSEAKRMAIGFEGEDKVYNELKRLLPKGYTILRNVHINNAEHDILIFGKNGFYSVEVKNHSGILEWDELGRFKEYSPIGRNGRRTCREAEDPYLQAMAHRTSLISLIDTLDSKKLNKENVSVCSLVTVPNDVTVRMPRLRPLSVYGIARTAEVIESWNAQKSKLSSEELVYLRQEIQKAIQKPRTYEFMDLTAVENFISESMTQLSEKLEPLNKASYQTRILADQLTSLEKEISEKAEKLEGLTRGNVIDEDAKTNIIPYLIFIICAVGVYLFSDLFKLICFAVLPFITLYLWVNSSVILKGHKKEASKHRTLITRIREVLQN